MQKTIGLVALIASLATAMAYLISRSRETPPATPKQAQSIQMPQLLIIKPESNGCLFEVQGGAQRDFQKWFHLPACPDKTENIIFDAQRHRVLVLQNRKYWEVDKVYGAEAKPLADAFESPIQGDFYSKTWIDKATKLLSVAYVVPVGDINENPEGDEIRKKFPILKDSWISLHHADGSPPEGDPAIAIVARLNEDGKWQILAEEKTACCADGAPDLEVVKDLIDEDSGVYSLADLLMQSTCEQQQCDSKKLNPSTATLNWIEKTFPSGEGDSVSYMPLGKHDGFLFHTEYGDSLHAMAPVYYCQNECSQHEVVDSPNSTPDFGQISFSQKSDHMIVSKEYEGQGAKVYVTGTAHPILEFDASTRAIWLPDDFQF